MRRKYSASRINSYMKQNLRQLFQGISETNPPEKLYGGILAMIKKEKERQLKNKLALSYVGLIGSFAAAIYTGLNFGSAILKSDFWSMLSLAFSDVMVVAYNWKSFSLSLLETFPAVSVAIILAPIFTLLISASFYIDLSQKNNHKYI